jgi:nucleoside transporter
MIADRFFSAERVLGTLHLIGAVIMYMASSITEPTTFFWVLLAYTLCYLPTIALCNSVGLDLSDDPQAEFPSIRVLGTIGWIVAGLIVGYFDMEATALPMLLAASVSVILGLYSFTLPNVPPKSKGKKVTMRDVLCLDALQLLKNRSFAVFVVSSLLICIPLAFYYNFTNLFLNNMGMENAASKMTLGQVSEVVFMLMLPFMFRKLGIKTVLVIGMFAWIVRYILFALGDNDALVWMYYGGILLHGVCYDFFFVSGYIYTDKVAPAHMRSSAQGLIILVTLGLGMLIGSYASGYWVQINTKFDLENAGVVTGYDWTMVWALPAVMAFLVAVAFVVLFKNAVPADAEQEATRG